MGFGVLFVNLLVAFLVILGQASMSGKVVLEGKTALADWGGRRQEVPPQGLRDRLGLPRHRVHTLHDYRNSLRLHNPA